MSDDEGYWPRELAARELDVTDVEERREALSGLAQCVEPSGPVPLSRPTVAPWERLLSGLAGATAVMAVIYLVAAIIHGAWR